MKTFSFAGTTASRVAQGCMRIGGMTAEAIQTVYGESIGVSDACLRYVKGSVELQFIIKDGKAVSIEYIPAE